MARHGRKYLAAAKQVEPQKLYTLTDAVTQVKKVKYTKFDESVDLSIVLGVDPRHADQMVRGTVNLPHGTGRKKRVLVVDDSITVREVERQLLLHKGYEVAVAVDGMDGWNKVRAERYDLMVSDIDMPRMNGLQLVQAVRADERLRDLPVIIVSYKEREEDRVRGLEVGANAYLTKSSFHDNRFMEAVVDLI